MAHLKLVAKAFDLVKMKQVKISMHGFVVLRNRTNSNKLRS